MMAKLGDGPGMDHLHVASTVMGVPMTGVSPQDAAVLNRISAPPPAPAPGPKGEKKGSGTRMSKNGVTKGKFVSASQDDFRRVAGGG
jgi:hypothetical protein